MHRTASQRGGRLSAQAAARGTGCVCTPFALAHAGGALSGSAAACTAEVLSCLRMGGAAPITPAFHLAHRRASGCFSLRPVGCAHSSPRPGSLRRRSDSCRLWVPSALAPYSRLGRIDVSVVTLVHRSMTVACCVIGRSQLSLTALGVIPWWHIFRAPMGWCADGDV